ncbi:MAG: dephospho-CoA kinase [Chitinophagaceae bacterium]|nr:dephospho-CoA kinase [Chitinophagaceae bacterium]
MLTIGITGGIGSGKTTVCKIFECLGIPVYNADLQAKKLYDTDLILKTEIITAFGSDIYIDEKFNPKKLAELVFSNPEKLTLLNSLVHPRVRANMLEWRKKQKGPYCIREAALLIESGAYRDVDDLILVSCPEEIRIKRSMLRDGSDESTIRMRMSKQMSESEKIKYCRYEIRNDEHSLLIPQVLKLHRDFLNQAKESGF